MNGIKECLYIDGPKLSTVTGIIRRQNREIMEDYLKYKDYLATVGYSASDKVLHGKIAGINDLVNFESDNLKDLEKKFKEAVNDYLATCKELEKEPEKV